MALGGAQLLDVLKRCPKMENQQNSILEIMGQFKYGQRPMQFINLLEFFNANCKWFHLSAYRVYEAKLWYLELAFLLAIFKQL